MPVQTQGGKQELRATTTQQVIIPMEGFIRSFSMQKQVIKYLISNDAQPGTPTGLYCT